MSILGKLVFILSPAIASNVIDGYKAIARNHGLFDAQNNLSLPILPSAYTNETPIQPPELIVSSIGAQKFASGGRIQPYQFSATIPDSHRAKTIYDVLLALHTWQSPKLGRYVTLRDYCSVQGGSPATDGAGYPYRLRQGLLGAPQIEQGLWFDDLKVPTASSGAGVVVSFLEAA